MKSLITTLAICIFAFSSISEGGFGKGGSIDGGNLKKTSKELYLDCINAAQASGRNLEQAKEDCKGILDEVLSIDSEPKKGPRGFADDTLKRALAKINSTELFFEQTHKNIVTIGTLAVGAVVVWKFAKSANFVGAFMAGMGLTAASAAEYCSRYESAEGMEYFFSLPAEEQLQEASTCVDLGNRLVELSEQL